MAEIDVLRGCLKNSPFTIWGQSFASLAPSDSEFDSHMREVDELKVKVKNMLLDPSKEITDNIQFINLLCRLGVNYHFEDEINEQLNRIFTMLPKLLQVNDYDLSTLANMFRVLRQYGYNMTSDVFKKFKDGKDGEFKKGVVDDIKGMLCLYEACFLAIDGEDVLDNALSFTRKHLEVLAERSSPSLKKHIKTALEFPSHRTIERLDALHYISFYEEDESANETLLNFAKMDYNGLQLFYRKELAVLTEWWKNKNFAKNYPYVRDRVAEAYMWALGTIFEPQYSFGRLILCKFVLLLTVLDDTYDSYGTIDELKLLTTAIQSFTVDAGDELPENMKPLYEIILEETENSCTEGCSCKTTYLREMVKEVSRCYLVETKWRIEGKAPSFEEYLRNGKVTSTFEIFASALILGMENIEMKEILWLRNDPKSAAAAKLICRLLNDIAVRKNETKREDFPKALDCYTKEHGVSEDEAYEAILKMVESEWKRLNEDLVKLSNMPTDMPRILMKHNLNFCRISQLYYGGIDLYTYASNMKQLIMSMFINPLPM